MTVSVIITTYNWKEALELCLLSLFRGRCLPDEILVADDGSREDTADLVATVKRSSPIPLVHVWQEDRGFRAARIRNKALATARGEYVLLMDGDIIAHPAFVEDHRDAMRWGGFVQGSRVLLSEPKTEAVLRRRQLHFMPWEWGLGNRLNALRLPSFFPRPSGEKKELRGIRTCNFAFWKKDALAVNGFDEDFVGWGREDSDFAARLIRAGVMRRDVKGRALVYHLHHPPRSRTTLERNDALLRESLDRRRTRCLNGLAAHLSET